MARLNEKDYSKEEMLRYCGNINQIGSITKSSLLDGKADGTNIYTVKTGGGLEYTLVPSKCLDITSLSFKGTNISLLAKPGITSPKYAHPFGNDFLYYVTGGMLFTCGLKNVGSSCEENGEYHPIHGRIGITPAQNTSARGYWVGNEYVLEAYGEMNESALFGSNLCLKRTISSKLGQNEIIINDVLENNSPYEEDFMLLYHFNFGFPFLDEDTKIIFPQNNIEPRDKNAEIGLKESEKNSLPLDNYDEQVFYRDVVADKDGKVKIQIINNRLGIKAIIEYEQKNLPILTQWKSMKSTDYALGIEPCNCLVFSRVKAQESGKIKKIKPFEKIEFILKLLISELI